jgi:uncharacterized membrane protein YraQ (UPF0718 family)
MSLNKEWKIFLYIIVLFLTVYFLPVGEARFDNAVLEALYLIKWYAREHVLLCLVPAFFIAGAVSVFIRKESVMKYLGGEANKVIAYGVASISGSVLAVCSCTVLPLFAGIYRMGAGLGPATAFLYSGPAINILAIVLTGKVLGWKIGLARAVGAVAFSIIIGLLMHFIFRKEEVERQKAVVSSSEEPFLSLGRNVLYFFSMAAILVFANWARAADGAGFWMSVYSIKWILTSFFALLLGYILTAWFKIVIWKILAVALAALGFALLWPGIPVLAFAAAAIGLAIILATGRGEGKSWFDSTWEFSKQILPLLFLGVIASGFLLGRPGHEGIIPSEWVSGLVGGNSLFANFFASIVGAFMYFATLTEVPIVEGLLGSGMGQGPALALLLAGPALSLPSMLVIRSILGVKKTLVYVSLVVVMATTTGLLFGFLAG